MSKVNGKNEQTGCEGVDVLVMGIEMILLYTFLLKCE
jgi:hypothetical protein